MIALFDPPMAASTVIARENPAGVSTEDGRPPGKNLLRAGKIHLPPLITHRFPLEAFPNAYRALREAAGPCGKTLLEVS